MEARSLSIVFWGEDAFSNVVLESLIAANHQVKLVVTPWYDNLKYKKLEFTCLKHSIRFSRCTKINSEETYKLVKAVKPDLCVITHFERLIKSPILELPRLGFINLHPSLLPWYRGMSPQHWPIIYGEKEAGVTVHYVDAGIDTGDIIVQERIPLGEGDYVSDLQKKWLLVYKYIVVEAINRILSGAEVTKQSHLPGSYFGRLTVEQCQIDLNDTVAKVYNLIRGISMPYHGAQLGDVIIWKAHPIDVVTARTLMNEHRQVGLYEDAAQKTFLRLKDGILILDRIQFLCLKSEKTDS